MSLHFTTLDVFTTDKFSGNPVAIVHVPATASLTQKQKQLIAREFNLSESVFLHERTEAELQTGDVRIDIFTPIAEIPFAGHPTVGTSNYLLRYLKDSPGFENVKALQAKAGRIPIQLSDDSSGIKLEVAHNVHIHNCPFRGRTFENFPVVSIVKGMTCILAKCETLEELAKPAQNLLSTEASYRSQKYLDEGWQEGPVVSYFYTDLGMESDGETRNVRTRMLGSREDPATGSAASALCSYLTLSNEGPQTRKYHIVQGVEMGRRSDMLIQVTLQEDGRSIKEVLLSGTAVKVIEGKVDVPDV